MPDDADVVYLAPTQRPAHVVRIALVAGVAAGAHFLDRTAARGRNRSSARETLDKVGVRWLSSEFDHRYSPA